ncbi:hypothetical protein LDL08_42210 [Nonomuraea glycinis]|uniref:hypothetical protein n=1 Tax=Nonomuraea glycinis TaxID=2047744 RepID=UPI001668FD4A|nr:hypothetical protein [Nonomuraea glycinis]MCA2182795.1 hypothetical protein [Nonomuraea glycinis]
MAAVVLVPGDVWKPVAEGPSAVMSEAAEPAFERQEDGGRFDSPKHLVQTLESLGIHCINAHYFRPNNC